MDWMFPQDRRLLRLTTAAVGGALLGAMVLGFYTFVHCPLHAKADWQRHRIDYLEKELSYTSAVNKAHRKLTAGLEDLHEQIKTVHRRVPDGPFEAEFLSSVTAIATRQGVEIKNFRHTDEVEFDEYSELVVSISGVGGFENVCRFLDQVNSLDRLSTVRRLSIRSTDDKNLYPVEVTYALQFTRPKAELDNLLAREAP